MLILSRFKDEVVAIGDDIRVMVVDVIGGRVKLGIAAPISTEVHRLEIYEQVCHERAERDRRAIDERLGR